MEEEIRKYIDEYLDQVELKTPELLLQKEKADKIIFDSKKEFDEVVAMFDKKFEANEISEKEYLDSFRLEKSRILSETKEKIDDFVVSLPKHE